jgi:hypothetical protein
MKSVYQKRIMTVWSKSDKLKLSVNQHKTLERSLVSLQIAHPRGLSLKCCIIAFCSGSLLY